MASFSLYDTAGSAAGVFIGGLIVYKALLWKLKDIVKAHDELKLEVRDEVKDLKDTKLDSERFSEIRSHIDTKFKYHSDQLNLQNRIIMSVNEKLDKLLNRRRNDRNPNAQEGGNA